MTAGKDSQGGRKDFKKDKGGFMRFYTYCKQEGHVHENSFKRIGYLDLYKGKKGKRGRRMVAQATAGLKDAEGHESPFDFDCDDEVYMNKKSRMDQKMVVAVYQEVMKMFKGKGGYNDYAQNPSVNFAGSSSVNFAGLTAAKPVHTPLPQGLKLDINTGMSLQQPDT